jgi:cation diffusion facilitator CzcD-associated flavoprotein CzcO
MNPPGTLPTSGKPPATASQATKTVIIGGGQAGLAMGYQLVQRVLP